MKANQHLFLKDELLLAEAILQKLLMWYQNSHRDLPWRKTRDPYCIWISEIMLQQTRVEAVKEYYRRFLEALPTVSALAKAEEEQSQGNDTELTVKVLNALPGFIKKFFVWAMRNLDAIGLMPKFINKVSPFHSTIFITNVGSLGLRPIYHHLYEFGTTSMFLAIGRKEIKNEAKRDGTIVHKHIVNMRFVLDERICDGYYFASAIKLFKYYVKNPELLLAPPDSISEDY